MKKYRGFPTAEALKSLLSTFSLSRYLVVRVVHPSKR